MWMPWQLPEAVLTDMQQKGLTLTAADLFSVEKPSVKDAIVLFGGGCTGEIVSPEGLLFTNHHCARGVLQQLSTLERDLLTHGYWAGNRQEELPCPGLNVTVINRVEEVTNAVLQAIGSAATESLRQRRVDSIGRMLAAQAALGGRYKAFVRPFYQGNQYFLFVTEEFRDVRLVGAPPQSIGNFGGDTDNWMWPRHTGDFAVFRIYAGKDNLPAAYSEQNVPYRPRHWLPISLKGVQAGDLTMVYGFPGRTSQYLTSYGVQVLYEVSNPVRIALRGERMSVWWQRMLQNDTVRLKYVAKYYALSNTHKKWQGEQYGLSRVDVVGMKRNEEALFRQRAAGQGVAGRAQLLDSLQMSYDSLRPYQYAMDCWNEAVMAIEVWRPALLLQPLVDSTLAGAEATVIESLREKVNGQLADFYRNYDARTDRLVMEALLQRYRERTDRVPGFLLQQVQRLRGDWSAYSRQLFERSLLDDGTAQKWLQQWDLKVARKVQADPVYQTTIKLSAYQAEFITAPYQKWNEQVMRLNRQYMQALMELFPERRFFPDANLTLRLTYGRVEGYQPRDGVHYRHYTTAKGVLEKYRPGDEEFDLPSDFVALIRSAETTPYANADGELVTCFVAANHTTGGNSGSPVLNARGELIGINFDRCWEGTMSDVYFDAAFCRNIAVDIRYVLFVIDRLGGAGYLLNELELRR